MVENDMELVPLGPESLEFNSFMQDSVSSGGSINQEVEGSVADLALAVPVQPANFLPREISPDELMGASPQSDQVEQNEVMQQQPIVQLEAVIQNHEPEH
jgi:hypothetical protein